MSCIKALLLFIYPNLLIVSCSAYDTGDMTLDCATGNFGKECLSMCHCINDTLCDPLNGSCSGGCDPYFKGPACQIFKDDEVAENNVYTIGIIALAITGSITAIIVVGYVCYKCKYISDREALCKKKTPTNVKLHNLRPKHDRQHTRPHVDVDNWYLDGSSTDFPPIKESDLDFKSGNESSEFYDSYYSHNHAPYPQPYRPLHFQYTIKSDLFIPKNYKPTIYDIIALDYDLMKIGICPYSTPVPIH